MSNPNVGAAVLKLHNKVIFIMVNKKNIITQLNTFNSLRKIQEPQKSANQIQLLHLLPLHKSNTKLSGDKLVS